MPMFNPMPPLILREESEAPMEVRMKAAMMAAKRLWYSIWNVWILPIPLFFWRSIYVDSSEEVIVSQSLTEIRKSEGTIVNVVSMRLPSVICSRIPSKSRIM